MITNTNKWNCENPSLYIHVRFSQSIGVRVVFKNWEGLGIRATIVMHQGLRGGGGSFNYHNHMDYTPYYVNTYNPLQYHTNQLHIEYEPENKLVTVCT